MKKMGPFSLILTILLLSLSSISIFGAEWEKALFLSNLPNPNDYSLFTSGGWDGNWYVGSNTLWIQKIRVPPQSHFKRAFLGARIGRMKSFQIQEKSPWLVQPYPGEIYVAISSTFSWNKSDSFSLTSTLDIPLESSSRTATQDGGESQWFWTEIPLNKVQFDSVNYIALWSPTKELDSNQKAPILAGGWGSPEINSWLYTSRSIQLPLTCKQKGLKPITVLQPAIALKLVPEQNENEKPILSIQSIEEGKRSENQNPTQIVWCSVKGNSVERTWLETSTDTIHWNHQGRSLWKAPYCFTLRMDQIALGTLENTWVRVQATDFLENKGTSPAVHLFGGE